MQHHVRPISVGRCQKHKGLDAKHDYYHNVIVIMLGEFECLLITAAAGVHDPRRKQQNAWILDAGYLARMVHGRNGTQSSLRVGASLKEIRRVLQK
jgi:hypothetical protein